MFGAVEGTTMSDPELQGVVCVSPSEIQILQLGDALSF
jgi:hypothetical protein